jgi:predicted ATP-grasp superfamily ATP-dependent carboligase
MGGRPSTRTPPGSPPAIIAGLDCMPGLGAARVLSGRGVRVIGVATDRRHPACRTRACDRLLVAGRGDEELVGLLRGLAEAGDAGVVIPCTDRAVLAVSRARERLLPHVASLPGHDTVLTLLDKARLYEHARREGLPIPRTMVVGAREEVLEAAAELGFPCVLKPRVKTAAWLERLDRKAYLVESSDELRALHRRVAPLAEGFVIQEWIPGDEAETFCCNGYYGRDGRPLATFVSRKVRHWPLDTGTTTLAVECRNDEVLERSIELFGGVGFHGLAQLEMRRSAATGEQLIVEANVGRPTGRAPIAEAGGVELLYTAYRDAAGLPLPAARRQHYGGVRWIYARNDLRAAMALRRRGELTPRAWLRSLRGPKAFAILSGRDPAPFVADLLRAAAKLPDRLIGRAGRAGP